MGVHVTISYACGGCDAKAESAAHPVRREFVSLFGGGVGVYRTARMPDAETVAPAGWVVFDEYTQQTYCPACWAAIEAGVEAHEVPAEPAVRAQMEDQ